MTLGITLALISALVWGAADFTGGVVSRRGHPFQVLLLSAMAGLIMLVVIAVVIGEPLPGPADLAWSGAAGVSGAVGIAALYRGLATGRAAIVAPVSGVLTAMVPVLFHALTAGWPASRQVAGFALASIGIWLVAGSAGGAGPRTSGLSMAVIAGLGFGGFLILIAQVPEGQVFAPLAVGRVLTLLTAALMLMLRALPRPPARLYPLAGFAGVLDAGGNVFYLLARQYVRLDVAAVLSSFYPVATVLLARLLLKEPVSGAQWLGAVVCLAAVGLITG